MLKKPEWLRCRIGVGPNAGRLEKLVGEGNLHTVCQEALCPNKGRCWENGRATLMILGDRCSRSCTFCNVNSSPPGECDTGEPARVAEAVKQMGLNEVVITSVTRDDLSDGGAGIWAETIRLIRQAVPGIMVEVLIPDFNANPDLIDLVLKARPDIVGHNLETVPSLYDIVRPQASYRGSLDVLKYVSAQGFIAKTGIMVGIGEEVDEVLSVMDDARKAECRIFFVGQYLQPSKQHLEVRRYVEPAEFEMYREKGLEKGFDVVVSEPLVRSSFHSEIQTEFVRSVLNYE